MGTKKEERLKLNDLIEFGVEVINFLASFEKIKQHKLTFIFVSAANEAANKFIQKRDAYRLKLLKTKLEFLSNLKPGCLFTIDDKIAGYWLQEDLVDIIESNYKIAPISRDIFRKKAFVISQKNHMIFLENIVYKDKYLFIKVLYDGRIAYISHCGTSRFWHALTSNANLYKKIKCFQRK